MERFSPDKYADAIKESENRLKITRSFREPDRIPVVIGCQGSFFCKLFGNNIRDFYTDWELNLEVKSRGLIWCYEVLKDDRTERIIGLELGPIAEGIYFDCLIEYPDDTSPRVLPKLKTIRDIENLKVVEPEKCAGLMDIYRKCEKLKQKVKGTNFYFGGIGIHPPISCACAIMDPVLVYEYLYTEQEQMHKFFTKLMQSFFNIVDFNDRYFGTKTETMWLADDNSAFISNEMYRKMVFPYNLAIYEKYGKKGRYFHADGPNDHHFQMYADEIKLTEMDIGGFSNIEIAKKYLDKKTVIYGGLNNKDLYQDLGSAKPLIERAIRIAAPGGGYIFGIGGETYPGINIDTLIKTVEYAKIIGKYPIRLKD